MDTREVTWGYIKTGVYFHIPGGYVEKHFTDEDFIIEECKELMGEA